MSSVAVCVEFVCVDFRDLLFCWICVVGCVDFAAFIGPPPQFNAVRFDKILDLAELNPTGFIACLIMLGLTLLICCYGCCEYTTTAKAAAKSDGDSRKKYDSKAATFARAKQIVDDDEVPWIYRTYLNLRTGWIWGAAW